MTTGQTFWHCEANQSAAAIRTPIQYVNAILNVYAIVVVCGVCVDAIVAVCGTLGCIEGFLQQ